MDWPSRTQIFQMSAMLLVGSFGGLIAWSIGLPLPFMVGGLLTTIPFVARANSVGTPVYFSKFTRMLFVGVIGALIGGTFTPDLIGSLSEMGFSLIGVLVYVVVAHFVGFLICRYLGGYDKPTAFFSSMPGGLVEAILLGERSGGDVRILTMMHFLRVLTVVVAFPLGFYIWYGDAVGSSAGITFDNGIWKWADVFVIFAMTGAGLGLGKLLHLPAWHLMGPLLVSSLVCGTGLWAASSPSWLLYLAQLFVGVGLGAQFTGASRSLFLRVFWISLAQVSAMLVLSAALALLFQRASVFDFQTLLLAYAPGGVSEMGLIALSLSISPVVVAAHHIFRIFLTVFGSGYVARYFGFDKD